MGLLLYGNSPKNIPSEMTGGRNVWGIATGFYETLAMTGWWEKCLGDWNALGLDNPSVILPKIGNMTAPFTQGSRFAAGRTSPLREGRRDGRSRFNRVGGLRSPPCGLAVGV